MRVRVTMGPRGEDRRVFVDGVDISSVVMDVNVYAKPDSAYVALVLVPDVELVAEGEVADVVRRIPAVVDPKEDLDA